MNTNRKEHYSSEQQRIEYIIDYTALKTQSRELSAFQETIAPFEPLYAKHVPYASVFVTPKQERVLTSTLDALVGVTYRRGEPRKASELNSLDGRIESEQ